MAQNFVDLRTMIIKLFRQEIEQHELHLKSSCNVLDTQELVPYLLFFKFFKNDFHNASWVFLGLWIQDVVSDPRWQIVRTKELVQNFILFFEFFINKFRNASYGFSQCYWKVPKKLEIVVANSKFCMFY